MGGGGCYDTISYTVAERHGDDTTSKTVALLQRDKKFTQGGLGGGDDTIRLVERQKI